MIPQKDLDQLIQYYKGELSENALLNKAVTLASKETSVVSRPPTPSGPGQCQNQTVESRINHLNQTHPSISWRGGCGCAGWTARRGRRRRGFGDGTRVTMVEAHDKRQSVHPQTPHHAFREERQSGLHQSNSHQERNTFYQSRRYPFAFGSRSRTSQDLGKTFSGKFFG